MSNIDELRELYEDNLRAYNFVGDDPETHLRWFRDYVWYCLSLEERRAVAEMCDRSDDFLEKLCAAIALVVDCDTESSSSSE